MYSEVMKKIAYLLLSMLLFSLAVPLALYVAPAHASDSATCYTISDADARNFCLAKARRESSMCYAIQRTDVRAACLAEVRK